MLKQANLILFLLLSRGKLKLKKNLKIFIDIDKNLFSENLDKLLKR